MKLVGEFEDGQQKLSSEANFTDNSKTKVWEKYIFEQLEKYVSHLLIRQEYFVYFFLSKFVLTLFNQIHIVIAPQIEIFFGQQHRVRGL
jgi:hypothetical protein